MDYRDNDPAIPTLTQKIDDNINEPPTLTDVVARSGASLPPDPVLRAALQAELEHTVQLALDQAMAHVRRSLEAELPALVDRVVSRLKPG
jgi:hypothetical protein